jgi:hypothetical protein
LRGKKRPEPVVIMEMLSAEYGWTPNEIMTQPFDVLMAYLEIINTKRMIENNKAKKYGR